MKTPGEIQQFTNLINNTQFLFAYVDSNIPLGITWWSGYKNCNNRNKRLKKGESQIESYFWVFICW